MTGGGKAGSPESALRKLFASAFGGGPGRAVSQEPDEFETLLDRAGWPEQAKTFLGTQWEFRPSRLSHFLERWLKNGSLDRDKEFLRGFSCEVERIEAFPWAMCEKASTLEDLFLRVEAASPSAAIRYGAGLLHEEAIRRQGPAGLGAGTRGLRGFAGSLNPGVPLVVRGSRQVVLAGWSEAFVGTPGKATRFRARSTRETCEAVLDFAKKLGWKFDGRPALPLRDWLGMRVDGASLGLSLWIFLLLREGGIRLPFPVAATGEVTGDGRLKAVSWENFDSKVEIALAAGYERVLVPRENLTGSSWADHPGVRGFHDLQEVRNWVFSHAAVGRVRNLVKGFLAGRWETHLGAEPVPGLESHLVKRLETRRLRETLRDWRREAVSLADPGAAPRLRSLHDFVAKVLRDEARAASHHPASALNLWEGVWPERLFLARLPRLLEVLSGSRSGTAETLYLSFIERLNDHDPDLVLAGSFLGADFESWLADRPRFRARFPALMWLRLNEPMAAMEWLTRLENPTSDEKRIMDLLLEGVGRIDPEACAGQGIQVMDSHADLMRAVAASFQPGFRPEVISRSTFPGRIADLWAAWFRLTSRARVGGRSGPLWKHLEAHLRAPRVHRRVPPLAEQFPELLSVLRSSPHLSSEELARSGREIAKWACNAEFGQVLDELARAFGKEAERARPRGNPDPARGEKVGGKWGKADSAIRSGISISHFFLWGDFRALERREWKTVVHGQPGLSLAVLLGDDRRSAKDEKWFLDVLGQGQGGQQHSEVISQCVAHRFGRFAGARDSGRRLIGRGSRPAWWEVPFLAGLQSVDGACPGDACPWRKRSPISEATGNLTLAWMAFLPDSCRGCIVRKSAGLFEKVSEEMNGRVAFQKSKLELRLAILGLLGWEAGGGPSGRAMMRGILREWTVHPDKPLRHEWEAVLPLLAMAATQGPNRSRFRTIFRDLATDPAGFSDLLVRRHSPISGARFLVRFLDLAYPATVWAEESLPSWDADRLRAFLRSTTDVEILQSLAANELLRCKATSRLENFLAFCVEDPPNLLFFSRSLTP